MKIFFFAHKYIKKYSGYLAIFILLNILCWGITILLPFLTGNYIDLLVSTPEYKLVGKITLVIVSIGIINVLGNYIQRYFFIVIQTKTSVDLNFDVLKHVAKMPLRYFDDKDSGYLNHRINNDSNLITSFVLENILSILTNLLTAVVLFYICLKINFKITVILVPILPMYLLLYFGFRKHLYNKHYDFKESQNKFFSSMNTLFHSINIIKINATFDESQKTVDDSFKSMFKNLQNYTRLSLVFSNINAITMVVASGIIFFCGGREIIRGNLTIGEFTILSSYFAMIMDSISYFLNFGDSYQRALVSHDRLTDILRQEKEKNGADILETIESITLKDVSFSYGKDTLIKNFNQEFLKGRVYCIIGKNGVGKSTLSNLILGIYNDYYNGEIYYNDKEIRDLDMYYIRKKIIGVSQQEPQLFYSTLVENLRYGVEIVSENEIESQLEQLGIGWREICNDYEEFNNGQSKNISGGEKLKISLSRAFLKKPDVLILDEPTSALDLVSIERLKKIINENKFNRITIIVTHDSDFLDVADEVLDLSKILSDI